MTHGVTVVVIVLAACVLSSCADTITGTSNARTETIEQIGETKWLEPIQPVPVTDSLKVDSGDLVPIQRKIIDRF